MCNLNLWMRTTQLAGLVLLLAAGADSTCWAQTPTPYQQMLRASVRYRFHPVSEVIEDTEPEVAQTEGSQGPSFYGPGPVQLDGTVDPGFAPPDGGSQPAAADDGDGDAFPSAAGVPEFNMQARVSEQWLNRFLSRGETREGAVRDFILGADVT
ncbi:MAG TPA: hypothetical protein VHB77_12160, partial [Planctomycetaceae bacterium]|nr:hypothetical protein [Planctomycetaceae bacterium]